MLTLACDFRVMRADRGFWCLPEADIGLPFSAGMAALIQTRFSPAVAREAMITARRYGGQQALEAGIVDAAVAENAVRDAALTMAAGQAAKAGPVLAAIKSRMDADVTRALRATGE
jgi:enoyl-CoA hydratase/carnithine racemase